MSPNPSLHGDEEDKGLELSELSSGTKHGLGVGWDQVAPVCPRLDHLVLL